MNINIEPIDEIIEPRKNSVLKKLLITLFIIIVIIFLFVVYARYKATSGLKVYEYKVTNSSLPDSFHGVKVVHLSDIHFGKTVDIKYLNNIVNKVNELKPDIVVFTGDLGDVSNNKQEVITLLASVNYTIGKYAISGEDDNDLFNEIFSNSGFINLNGISKFAYYNDNNPIMISNVNSDFEGFKLLLIHEPDKIDEYNNFDLVFAGHSHNGQIDIPFFKNLFLPDGAKRYYDRYYRVNDTDFYISSGIGTNDFKFRLFNKPSVNLYRLTKY
ncbi:MAG: metallophosphoesterase family protein [Bacilli bacterium]|nr:metallophosphoesterase family protein [Bacilli bacterium]